MLHLVIPIPGNQSTTAVIELQDNTGKVTERYTIKDNQLKQQWNYPKLNQPLVKQS